MSRKTVTPPPAPANPFIVQPHPVTVVTLDQLRPLAGLHGCANREIDFPRARRIAKRWREKACGVLAVWQENPKVAQYHMISGHHRREAMIMNCDEQGIPQKNKLVQVHIYGHADAAAEGKTPRQFIDDLMKACNEQKEQRLADNLQSFQNDSPWVKYASANGFVVEFNSNRRNQYTWSGILKVYISVQRAFANIADGTPNVTIASRFRVRADADEILDAFVNPDIPTMRRVLDALMSWERIAALPLSNNKVYLRGVNELAFVVITNLDPFNVNQQGPILADMPKRFVNPNPNKRYTHIKKVKDRDLTTMEVVRHMLHWVNQGRTASKHLTVFGLSTF